MSFTHTAARLVRLGDTERTVADPAADIRGRTVVDRNDEKVGKVDDLLIDDDESRVRFLRIGSGGFLGIGKDHFLVPVDAVTAVENDQVRIDGERERLTDVPGYDPDIAYEPAYYGDVYGWWGYSPFWAAGYVYPPYPYYR